VTRHWAKPTRVLLVDDSEASRAAVGRILEGSGVVIVGAARDGEEALREVLRLEPDMIFLDLQMPRMDGFTFLRLLMARRPTPVVVVSSQSRRSDAFKALELGALDFVAKPEGNASFDTVAATLIEKCELLRAIRPENLGYGREAALTPPRGAGAIVPLRVVAIGASTGGPQALQRLFATLSDDLPLAFVVAQHMPEHFTGSFAERIARTTRFTAQEAAEGDLLAAGRVLVAPGGRHLEVRSDERGALRAAILPAEPVANARHCPSVDRLLVSVAQTVGRRACAVVLTGMGQDGRAGVVAIKRAGGLTLAESQETAVVYGMPQAAAESGALDELLPFDRLVERIARFGRGK